MPSPPSQDSPPPHQPLGLLLVRHGLPVLLIVIGVIGIIIGHGKTTDAGAGVVLIGIGAMVWMLNWLFRLSLSSNRDRDRDEEARDYYSEHGHWPGEGAG